MTIVGARPQFIKAAVVSRAIRCMNSYVDRGQQLHEVMVHTGQHYDENMSAVFFREMQLPEPAYYLNVGGLSQGAMTGRILEKTEHVILEEGPDIVIVFGDTNSTLAGALAASKLGIPVVHIEAGLRSFNRGMPEEINRVIVDHISDMLFCPTDTAVENLNQENVQGRIYWVGDVMCDAVLFFKDIAKNTSVLDKFSLRWKSFFLATIHRMANTDNPDRLRGILEGFERLGEKVILAAHPRCSKAIAANGLFVPDNVLMIDPVSYLDMLHLEMAAKAVLTDSGGMQKEAYLLEVPCITMRDETEWTETVALGWNQLTGADPERMVQAAEALMVPQHRPSIFGDGKAAERIVKQIMKDSKLEQLP